MKLRRTLLLKLEKLTLPQLTELHLLQSHPSSLVLGDEGLIFTQKAKVKSNLFVTWMIFLSDPGKPGVRSLGPDVCH